MTKALVVQVDGTALELDLNSLADTQAQVGGWIELVALSECSIYINEEGKLDGLPFNPRATQLAQTLGWVAHDVLVGPAVFMGPVDNFGEDTDVTREIVDLFSDLNPSI